MRDKKIEVDATLREIPAYTLGEVPIFRWEHRLEGLGYREGADALGPFTGGCGQDQR